MEEEERQALGKQLMEDLEREEQKSLKKAQDKDLKKEIEGKDWYFLQFVWVIALLMPVGFWLWPRIPVKWLPTANVIMIFAGIIVTITLVFKLRKFINIIKEIATDDPTANAPLKPLSNERQSIQLKVDFECNAYSCKPLTKSGSSQYNYKKNETIQYRHESKIKGDKVDGLLGPNVTQWGGSDNMNSASGSDRGIKKKAPNR